MNNLGKCEDCAPNEQRSLDGLSCDPKVFCQYWEKLIDNKCKEFCEDKNSIYYYEDGEEGCFNVGGDRTFDSLNGSKHLKAKNGMKFIFASQPNFNDPGPAKSLSQWTKDTY